MKSHTPKQKNAVSCEHLSVRKNVSQTKKIANCEFCFTTSVCSDCGATLWTKDVERQYAAWAKLNRDKFIVQFSIPSDVFKRAEDIVSSFPNVTESDFVRAALSVYIGFVFSNQSLSSAIESAVSSDTFKKELLKGP